MSLSRMLHDIPYLVTRVAPIVAPIVALTGALGGGATPLLAQRDDACTPSYWTGTMGRAEHERPIVLLLTTDAACGAGAARGAVEARLRMSGEHANDFPLADVRSVGDSVSFDVLGAGGAMRFAGVMDGSDASRAGRLEGSFFRGSRAIPASLARVAARPIELDTALISGSAHAAVTWPIPRGWSAEKLVLPLPKEFVPDLPLVGWEVMRSSPHFADSTSDGYWSYSFAWWMPTDSASAHETDASVLQDQLRRYFRGLAAYGDVPAARRDSTVVTLRQRAGAGSSQPWMDGDATIFDFANGGRAVHLTVAARVLTCADAGRTAVVVAVAPTATAAVGAGRLALSLPAAFSCGARDTGTGTTPS